MEEKTKDPEAAGKNQEHSTDTSDGSTSKEAGTARIKAEFINHDHKSTISKYLPKHITDQIKVHTAQADNAEAQADNSAESNKTDGEPPAKKAKMRGRFKNSKLPRKHKIKAADKLCPNVIKEETCPWGEKCKFSHDVKKFITENPSRTDEECYNFKTFGKCKFGVTCTLSSSHISDDYRNIINEELVNKCKALPPQETNGIPKTIGFQLSKRKYDFSQSDALLKLTLKGEKVDPIKYLVKRPNWNVEHVENRTENSFKNGGFSTESSRSADTRTNSSNCDKNNAEELAHCISKSTDAIQNKTPEHLDQMEKPNVEVLRSVESSYISSSNDTGENSNLKVASETSSRLLDAEGIKFRPNEKKKVDFRDKLYLAPLTTVGNLPFRRICKEYGTDITCSEMATSAGLLQGNNSEWALMKRHYTEDIFGAQICGSYPDMMARCTQALMENTDVDFIDINVGCPIDLFFKRGEGCALMGKAAKLDTMIRSMVPLMDVPLTVKMRTGIFQDKPIAHKLIHKLKETDVSALIIHGRSREQRYTRQADWQYIDQCCKEAQPLPVIGCGDILSYEDYKVRRRETGVAGCMIARGALIKPWVFTEIKEERDWDISSSERFDMLKRFSNYGLEHWGSDAQGVATTRKFLLEWLSFLHRYIPVGLLERPPQRINEKPPHYFGRNDLETLMASRNCDDWVKISEMLLGPVPDGFEFVPKHKANAYT